MLVTLFLSISPMVYLWQNFSRLITVKKYIFRKKTILEFILLQNSVFELPYAYKKYNLIIFIKILSYFADIFALFAKTTTKLFNKNNGMLISKFPFKR